MLQLLRRDFSFILPVLLGILVVPAIFLLLQLPQFPFSTYLIFLYLLLFAPYYQERIKQMDRFMISLPIRKSNLVLARYISLIAAAIVGTVFVLGFEALFYENPATKSPVVMLVLFTFLFTVIAVALPVFYYFNKPWKAFLVQFLLMIVGNILFFVIVLLSPFDQLVHFVLAIVDWNPSVVLLLFSLITLSLSYQLSCFIYAKKDH